MAKRGRPKGSKNRKGTIASRAAADAASAERTTKRKRPSIMAIARTAVYMVKWTILWGIVATLALVAVVAYA